MCFTIWTRHSLFGSAGHFSQLSLEKLKYAQGAYRVEAEQLSKSSSSFSQLSGGVE